MQQKLLRGWSRAALWITVPAILVMVAGLGIPQATAATDRVDHHRYHRMTEAERHAMEESIQAAMQTVHQALSEAFEDIEIDLDDLDLSGLESLQWTLDDADLEFEFDGEEFSRRMEDLGERLGSHLEELSERFDREGFGSWSSRTHERQSSRQLRSEIDTLRERIRELEDELDARRSEGGI